MSVLHARLVVGVATEQVGTDCLEAELAARADAERLGCAYVSPYNDVDVMAGQGTIAIELLMATNAGA